MTLTNKLPILLSFYGLSNGNKNLLFGQLTYTPISDLSFKDYSRRKTFRTLFRLYQTRPYSNKSIVLVFDKGEVKAATNSYGAFYVKPEMNLEDAVLMKVVLEKEGDEVKIIDNLYDLKINTIKSSTIVVSDIDDTLIHSFIYQKLRKIKTMMFTTMEKRKAVAHMLEMIKKFTEAGAEPVYLSNSEQNLYPMIYRFLRHNHFPEGPLFLKQLRSIWDLIWNIKFPVKNTHKINTLNDIIALFPEKKYILIGDNTQADLQIYLSVAEKYGSQIQTIIIRKVIDKKEDELLLEKESEKLKAKDIKVYYAENFPSFVFPPKQSIS